MSDCAYSVDRTIGQLAFELEKDGRASHGDVEWTVRRCGVPQPGWHWARITGLDEVHLDDTCHRTRDEAITAALEDARRALRQA